MIEFEIGSSGQSLAFRADVLRHFEKHRQVRWYHREAGGQLFARIGTDVIEVSEATGPRLSDLRGRTRYVPDRNAEQSEIEARFQLGLHYVGDWHTHPTRHPVPSHVDLTSIQECVVRSTHDLNGFIHVIVGTAAVPDGICVFVCDSTSAYTLFPRVCDK